VLHPDPRAYRVALVADSIVNEGGAGYDAVALLDDAEFGIIVLPPSDFAVPTIASIVEYVVDDLADYRAKGYVVLIVGHSGLPDFGVWLSHVDGEVARRGIPPFTSFDTAGTHPADLVAVLADLHPSPSASTAH